MDPDADHIFDSTVLSAFCLVERLDLLAEHFRGRAHWTIEVYDEIARGIADTPRLSKILAGAWLGEPIRSFAVADIERIRLALGGKPRDRRHLGEAATIAAARAGGLARAIHPELITVHPRDVELELGIGHRPHRGRPAASGVVARRGDRQGAADRLDLEAVTELTM